MIIRMVIMFTFFSAMNCYPYPKNINIPDLDVSTPEEVNSLEREEPLRRSIDPVKTQNNIEDTVKQVEDLIKSNPALPRLTRGEILDLLENITATDAQKANILGNHRDPKAVMVVMPYTPTNDKNMEDLYTKAPVTHIIGAEPFKTKEETNTEKHSRRRPPVRFNDADNDLAKKTFIPQEKDKYSVGVTVKPVSSVPPVRRKRPETTTQPAPTTPAPTTYHPPTRKSVRRRTTTQHPNHRYPEEFVPSGGLRIIQSPKLSPPKQQNELTSDLDFEENIKQEVVFKHEFPISASFVHSKPNEIKITTPKSPTTLPLIKEINFPDHLQTVVKDLNLESAISPESEELRAKLEQQNKIKNILASIGVLAPSTTTTTTTRVPNAESVAESLSPEMRDLLMSFGLLPNPNEKQVTDNGDKYYPEHAEVKPESYIGFKPLPDDGPSREGMDALLASFGLGRNARKHKSLRSGASENEETFSFDMIPESLKSVVTDLGIEHVTREPKKIRASTVEKTVEKQHVFNPDTQYATEEELKKLEKLINMIKQLEKMNGTATEEDLKKLDLESLKELVTSLNGPSDTLETLDEKVNYPDPTAFDVGIIKNEVKRQESTTVSPPSSSSSIVATTSTSTTSTTTASTVTEEQTPSLKDLEDSFGGKTDPPTEPPIPETTTRRTGFYYLVDWNTFLDIDDTKGKRVNLRFQPTIGDPKRFLSVSVP